MTRKAPALAIATKNFKRKELKTWEQIMEYQRRGWTIMMVK